MKKRLAEMEAEHKKITEMQQQLDAASGSTTKGSHPSAADQAEIDSRSIYVSQVDYSTTPEELQQLFEACGVVSRVTILVDKITGKPKGFAYVEFANAESVVNAMLLNETEFKGRVLKISPKRTNVPAFERGRGRVNKQTRAEIAPVTTS